MPPLPDGSSAESVDHQQEVVLHRSAGHCRSDMRMRTFFWLQSDYDKSLSLGYVIAIMAPG